MNNVYSRMNGGSSAKSGINSVYSTVSRQPTNGLVGGEAPSTRVIPVRQGQSARSSIVAPQLAAPSRVSGITPRQQQHQSVSTTAPARVTVAPTAASGVSSLSLAALSDELHGAVLTLRDDIQLQYDEPLEKTATQLELLGVLVQEQANELVMLRQELDIVSLGSLRVRLLEDCNVFETKDMNSSSYAVHPAGTMMKVYHPFEMNQFGLWATCKQITLTSSGLSITGGVMLIGRANAEVLDDGPLIEPLVDILQKSYE